MWNKDKGRTQGEAWPLSNDLSGTGSMTVNVPKFDPRKPFENTSPPPAESETRQFPLNTGEDRRVLGPGGAPTRATILPREPDERKKFPVASGVLRYFPDALAYVSHISWAGNEQHNPGMSLRWTRGKSSDEEDTMIRHTLEGGTVDVDNLLHSGKMAWRALAVLQKEIEDRQARGLPIPMYRPKEEKEDGEDTNRTRGSVTYYDPESSLR